MSYSHELNALSRIMESEAVRTCPCGHISNETTPECSECGMSESDLAYYDENGLTPEKPLCFE